MTAVRIRPRFRFAAACCVLALLLPAVSAAAPARAPESTPKPIDVNRASADELLVVPGIGEEMARRIVAFREEHGPYQRIEDLLKVRGIGEKSFQKLRRYLTVAGGK